MLKPKPTTAPEGVYLDTDRMRAVTVKEWKGDHAIVVTYRGMREEYPVDVLRLAPATFEDSLHA